jgi:predicted permease
MHLALPPAYYIPFSIAVTLPGSFPEMLEQRTIRGLEVRARVRPKVSVDQAREEVALLANALEQAYPDTNRNVGLLVRTSFQARLDERGPSAPAAFMLLTLAFVVLLVACANVAGLLTSRGPERQREIALRMAIGGDRFRVTRQLITESLLLAAAGGALGLAMAAGAMVFLSRLPLVSDIGVHLTFDLDRRAIVVGIALATASAFLSSLVPAWRATRAPTLATTLRTTADHAHGPVRLWGRNGLVAAQVALSLMLLTVTVSMYRAFEMELGQPGFKTTHMLLASFEPRLARYDESRSEAFFKLLKERVRGVAGVRAVGMTSVMPLNQDTRDPATIVPEGFQLPRGTDSIIVLTSRIDEGYLDTMGIPIVRGRNIQTTDTADSARVALVNQTTASRYWPGQDPIGKRIRFMDRNGQPWIEVVGVTADSKSNWIGEGPTPWIYVSRLQDPGFRTTVLIASAADSASIASSIRDVVRDIDPNMPVAGMRTMEEFYDGNATGMVRALVRIVGTMGLLGLTLGMIGLYGLVAYVVARRTREIGIRMAVGAKPGTVLRSVLGSGAVLAASGIAVGVLGCIAIRGLLQSVFPGTGGIDLATYALVVPTLVAVTLIASYIPARRAAQIDPLRALRTE